MKTCGRCNLDKTESEFGINRAKDDGLQGYCRDCTREYARQRGRTKPIGWVRKTADIVAYQKAYRESHKERMAEQIKDWHNAHPEKDRKKHERKMMVKHGPDYVVGDPGNIRRGQELAGFLASPEQIEFARKRRKAKEAVKSALRNGSLTRQPCACCGAEKVEGHHPDYDAHLDVVWLCKIHHLQVHKEHRENV